MMFNVQNEVVKLMQASLNSALCLSSHAIDTFASALGYSDCPQERERLGEPTLVKSDAKRLDWWSLIQALCSMTQRAVVAIDEDWLEDHFDDDHGYDQPMAMVYEVVGDELFATEAKLHHSRSGKARLCSGDLSQEYVLFEDGSAGWAKLPKAFTKRAAIGVQRAGERWFWDHDELTTQDIVAGMREMEEEERPTSSVSLPGVVLNMGRWRKPGVSDRAA